MANCMGCSHYNSLQASTYCINTCLKKQHTPAFKMKEMFIKIYGVSDISTFVANAIQIKDEITVIKDECIINGKSLLGMFAFDLSTGVTVRYPEYALMFEEFLRKFKAE